jgi:hypothetical protein
MKPCPSKINQSTPKKKGEYKEQNGSTLSKKTKTGLKIFSKTSAK